MPSTRRTLLAAALAAAAGSSRLPPRSEPATGATESTETGSSADGPELARWSDETRYDSLGLVALGGGPETPSIYAGSAPTGRRTATGRTRSAR